MSRQAGVLNETEPERAKTPRRVSYTTPLSAVRKTCLYCAHTSPAVKSCPGKPYSMTDPKLVCPLHPLRLGKRIKGVWPAKVMRQHCLWCMSYHSPSVEACTDRDCPSWPYRFGMKPATARKLGKDV